MKDGRAEQYRGRLSAAEIAAGMNAAARNACRLLADAELLFENERFPSALSMAVLAIEEAGKVSILRGLSVSPDDKRLIAAWRDYRSHTAKNAAWIIIELARGGARTLEDLRPIVDPKSDHSAVLDSLKQIGFYTDCYGKKHWSEPQEIIDKKLTENVLISARVLCRDQEITVREIELWMEHVGPHSHTQEMGAASLRFYEAMIAEGLSTHDLEDVRRFYGQLAESDHG